MAIFIINSDLTASADTKKPERGNLTKATYRDVLKRWSHKNKYYLGNRVHEKAGDKVEGELRAGFLFVTKNLSE